MKLKREEGLQRERLKKNQEKEYYEALANDKKMEAEKTKEKVDMVESNLLHEDVSSLVWGPCRGEGVQFRGTLLWWMGW